MTTYPPGVKVIDDVITPRYQEQLEHKLKIAKWRYTDKITYGDNDDNDPNSGFAWVGYIKEHGNMEPEVEWFFPLLYEAIYKYDKNLRIHDILRIRGTMFIKNQNEGAHVPHRDLRQKHTTMVYYVNDSDGPTNIYDSKTFEITHQVEPKKGRALIFPGTVYHSSSTPKKTAQRLILNYNFIT